MEFLRFGSSIPGSYWGCCACCIIQKFNVDPDQKASIELVDGDGGHPLGDRYFGKTYREIFESRIITGTFNDSEMPNHIFLAILTAKQLRNANGKKWLAILKENGFEFIRTTDNSVYSGSSLTDPPEDFEDFCDDCDEPESSDSINKNYLFGLFRNIGFGKVLDPFEPPKEWLDLEGGVSEVSNYLDKEQGGARWALLRSREKVHMEQYKKLTPVKIYTQQELKDADIPITLAGRRSEYPQEPLETREFKERTKKKLSGANKKGSSAPCASSSSEPVQAVEA